jgi:nitrogen fixation protein
MARFNRLPHELSHRLNGSGLFELSRVADLAESVATRKNPHLAGGDVYFNDGSIEAGEKPQSPDLPRTAAIDFIREIETSQAWIILKHIERDPDYRPILESCILDILELSGRELLRKIKWFEAILFVTSPNRVTEYHIDREVSWILQIQGDKEIHLFDRADKSIVPDEELEAYWTADQERWCINYAREAAFISRSTLHIGCEMGTKYL